MPWFFASVLRLRRAKKDRNKTGTNADEETHHSPLRGNPAGALFGSELVCSLDRAGVCRLNISGALLTFLRFGGELLVAMNADVFWLGLSREHGEKARHQNEKGCRGEGFVHGLNIHLRQTEGKGQFPKADEDSSRAWKSGVMMKRQGAGRS